MATVMAARWVNNGGKGREIRLADYHHMDIWPIFPPSWKLQVTHEKRVVGVFDFMMESWIFKSNIEWKLLVWNVVLPMERFIHIHLDLADYKVIKTDDKHALLKPSVPIHSTRRPVKRNKQTKFWDSPLIFYSEHGNISKKFRDSVFHWIYSPLKC